MFIQFENEMYGKKKKIVLKSIYLVLHDLDVTYSMRRKALYQNVSDTEKSQNNFASSKPIAVTNKVGSK